MYHEATQHDKNCFITLTYANPAPPCLSKRDLQLFFKRLRKLCRLRYFAVGEYGKATHRPHYHAIVYGMDFLGHSYPITDKLYGHEILDKAWGKGLCSVAECNLQTIQYVAGYVNKKIGDSDTFNLMSRRPGIGHTWLDRYRDDIVRTGKIAIQGKEFSVPKRYLEWYQDDFEALKKARAAYYQTLTPQDISTRRENLPHKEINYKARLELKQETI